MMDEYGLVRQPEQDTHLASPGDVAAFQDALLRLLERQTAIHTMGDSTSVPRHVAGDLLLSICFVLGIDPEDREVPEYLLGVELQQEFRRRLADVGRKVEAAEKLWREVCLTMPLIPNVALKDTLKELGNFFKCYDYRSMAHDIPCSIDYPLCQPVDESLLGIEYIDEYLRRLMIEAKFLTLFDVAACEQVLAKASPDYIELLVNLCEPVAVNALGLAVVGEEPSRLTIGDAERDAIGERLGSLGDAGRERVLGAALVAACKALGVDNEDAGEYLGSIVPELLPRIAVGLKHGSLRGVFVG